MSVKEISFPKRPFKTHGGAAVPHRKNTAEADSVIMPCPTQIIVPMSQHIGAPCVPTVRPGDTVRVGDVIADSDKFVSAPIHSSISGTVKKIAPIQMPNGSKIDAVYIEADGEMAVSQLVKPPVVETVEDLIRAARASGLVGLGGAGFPAHIKLNVPKDKEIDTLIINVAECEPYITADNREALENSWEVLSGIYEITRLLNISGVIIAVEDNKPLVIKELRKMADNKEYDPKDIVRVLPLKAKYPQGAEKVLIEACTKRRVPVGKLPADVGCIVMNVTSVACLSKYIKTGMPLVTKRLTIDGSAIKNPQNVIVPIGTPISEVIEFCGGYKEPPKKLLMGGPMMGIAITDDTLPVLKQNNAILAFAEKDAILPEPSACIRCGRCVKGCPMNLVPPLISRAIAVEDMKQLEKLGVMTCMECGCCAFNCPAGKHLVQNMRVGKAKLRDYMTEQKNKEGKE